jgi:hypothetical protein
MNHNDDTRDPLRDRLRAEAMTERTPFSPQIHHDIMRRVRNPQPVGESSRRIGISRWIIGVAAAICLSVGAFAIIRLVNFHRAPSVKIAVNPPTAPSDARQASFPLTLNIGGVFSARFWPPELAIRLPIAAQSQSPRPKQLPPPSYDPPGSPEWLFARIQQPATSAQMALADIIPPDMRALDSLAKLHQ